MRPADHERRLQNLMNNLHIAISGGKEIYEEGYAEDVEERTLKAEEALEKLKEELKSGWK